MCLRMMGAVLGLDQAVVAGTVWSGAGLFDSQFLQQARHGVVDELAAVVGVEAADRKWELLQNGLQHRKQPQLGDLRCGRHDFPLRHFVHGIDVIQTLVPVLIALMYSVDAQVSG